MLLLFNYGLLPVCYSCECHQTYHSKKVTFYRSNTRSCWNYSWNL